MKKRKQVPRAVAAASAPRANPFELKSSKRKFEVLGRREKQGSRNVIQSREEAVERVRL